MLEGEKTQDQEDGKDQLEKSIETNSTSNLEINNNDLHRGEIPDNKEDTTITTTAYKLSVKGDPHFDNNTEQQERERV